jgi:hypothetical protein
MSERWFFWFLLIGMEFSAHAQDMSSMMAKTFATPSVSFEHSTGQFNEQRFALGVPIYRGNESMWALTSRSSRTDLGDDIVFSRDKREIPREFGEADFGVAWSHEDAQGNKISFSATCGEAGTRLFGGGNAAVLNATGIIERKKSDHSWLYFLSYGNNRTILNNIPIPGVAYTMTGQTYMAGFGLPFAFINWRPDPWMLNASLSPFGAIVEPSYRFYGPLQGYLNVNWTPKSYANLIDNSDERLLYDKKEIGAGLRMILGRRGSVSLGYVHIFDRRLLIAKSIREDAAESIDLKETDGLQLKFRFAL